MDDEKNKITPDQLARMLGRYAKVIDEHFAIMGETYGSRELELARGAIEAALAALRADEAAALNRQPSTRHASAQHLTGFVQGVLLCKNLVTWEYLAEDDRRL